MDVPMKCMKRHDEFTASFLFCMSISCLSKLHFSSSVFRIISLLASTPEQCES